VSVNALAFSPIDEHPFVLYLEDEFKLKMSVCVCVVYFGRSFGVWLIGEIGSGLFNETL
jgi:hypothetical protein